MVFNSDTGKLVVFDDSFLHWAANPDSQVARAVLHVTFPHPALQASAAVDAKNGVPGHGYGQQRQRFGRELTD